MPKGTEQGSVVAGSDPACTLLQNATNSDFVPKLHRPTRPTTIPSVLPVLRMQIRFCNDCLAKLLRTFHNSKTNKGNCNKQACFKYASQSNAVPSNAIPIKMQSRAMQFKQCNPSDAIHIFSSPQLQCKQGQLQYVKMQSKAMQCKQVQLQPVKAMFQAKCNPKTSHANAGRSLPITGSCTYM